MLRRGRTVFAAKRDEVTADTLTGAMIGGEELSQARTGPFAQTSPSLRASGPVFRADKVTLTDARGSVRVHEATFEISAGEIVGIAAVEGSGQRELLRALAGRLDRRVGRARASGCRRFRAGGPPSRCGAARSQSLGKRGAPRRRRSPWDDRLECGRLRRPSASCRPTTSAPRARAFRCERSLAAISRSSCSLVSWSSNPRSQRALVVENPTRGLDVRATADVHARLRRAALDGAAIVLYSSDIDEVLLLANSCVRRLRARRARAAARP